MTAPDLNGRQGVARLLPWHLTVAWLTVAFLYLAHPRWLPSPFPAFVISTLIAVAASGLLFTWAEQVPAGRSGRTQGPVVARPEPVTAPSVEPMPPNGATRSPIEVHRYAGAPADECQCPHCGGFDVAGTPEGSATCRTCRHQWRTEQQPTVVIRSWLHQQ